MRERTIVLSSLGKSFSLTGWKIGWAIAPPHLTAGIRAAHQFLTFCSATPLQHATIAALQAPPSYFDTLRAEYAERRTAMVEVLRQAGFDPMVPEGSYFVLADHTRFGHGSDEAFCEHLIRQVGVAAIPCSPFYADPAGGRAPGPLRLLQDPGDDRRGWQPDEGPFAPPRGQPSFLLDSVTRPISGEPLVYAIFEDSGTQILVRKDDEIQIDLRPLTEGQKTITFEKVLAIGAGDGQPAKIGLPYLAGATVTAEIVGEDSGPKLRIGKYSRRKGYRRTLGHRQDHILVKVTGIKA